MERTEDCLLLALSATQVASMPVLFSLQPVLPDLLHRDTGREDEIFR